MLENQSLCLGDNISAWSCLLGLRRFWAQWGLLTHAAAPLIQRTFSAEGSLSPRAGTARVARRSVLPGAAFSSLWTGVYYTQLCLLLNVHKQWPWQKYRMRGDHRCQENVCNPVKMKLCILREDAV